MKYVQWQTGAPAPEAVAALAAAGIPALLAQILAARGVSTPTDAAALLGGAQTPLNDPLAMADMAAARDRVRLALDRGERICVFGDYDVDGITSTCLLTEYLRSRGGQVQTLYPRPAGGGLRPLRPGAGGAGRRGRPAGGHGGLRRHRRGRGRGLPRAGHGAGHHRSPRLRRGAARRRRGGGPPPARRRLSLQGAGGRGRGLQAGRRRRGRAGGPAGPLRRSAGAGHRGRRDAPARTRTGP